MCWFRDHLDYFRVMIKMEQCKRTSRSSRWSLQRRGNVPQNKRRHYDAKLVYNNQTIMRTSEEKEKYILIQNINLWLYKLMKMRCGVIGVAIFGPCKDLSFCGLSINIFMAQITSWALSSWVLGLHALVHDFLATLCFVFELQSIQTPTSQRILISELITTMASASFQRTSSPIGRFALSSGYTPTNKSWLTRVKSDVDKESQKIVARTHTPIAGTVCGFKFLSVHI